MYFKILYLIYTLFIYLNACECALFFPTSSTYGIFAAIAVPLDLPHRNVFVSYNFEGNYNLPETWGTPPVFNSFEEDGDIDIDLDVGRKSSNYNQNHNNSSDLSDMYAEQYVTTTEVPNETTSAGATEMPARKKRALLSRTNIYSILRDNFERNGFNGESCLLRLICETNASELGDVNGVLGSLVQVLFSPSSSEGEGLPLAYYQAEYDGYHDHCHYYEEQCRHSLLDLITAPFDDIFKQIESNKMFNS